MNEKRLIVALFGVVVATVLAFLAYRFIAALTVSVFLYYSTRRFYNSLGRLHLPARIRAFLSISLLAVPLVLLISYTVVLVATEARRFIENYPVVDAAEGLPWLQGVEDIPPLTVNGLVQAYRSGQFDVFIQFAQENAAFVTGTISSFLLNLLIVVVVTYYALIDGHRIHDWLLRFDDEAIVREYLEAADDELESVLFGNLLNVIAIAIIAIVTFSAYNAVAPPVARVPYPALAGALTGIASLIPVVGMKIVYVPHAIVAAVPIVIGSSELAPLVYIGGYLVVAIVVVDTIPDLVLRPYLSGETTHVGLLMLAYIFGPVVFGFYGLFFAPIVLVLGATFADTALPRLLGAETTDELPDDQRRLSDF